MSNERTTVANSKATFPPADAEMPKYEYQALEGGFGFASEDHKDEAEAADTREEPGRD